MPESNLTTPAIGAATADAPEDAEVVRYRLLSLQVCVPRVWSDEQAEDFANRAAPTGIESRWSMRKDGHPHLNGDDARVQCVQHAHRVHIVLDC
jgi:hypothetical protein